MKNETFLKKYLSFIFALVLICQLCVTVLPVNGEEAIYGKILRLHVLANSDSDTDQKLKLEVRDAVLAELERVYAESGVIDVKSAETAVKNSADRLISAAEKVIAARGFDYSATLEICDEYYPTREYENIILPAGTYRSVKVKLGAAEGKNWWCVLFPELCLSSAAREEAADSFIYEENGEKFIAAGFTPSELRIITDSDDGKIKVKFRVLEILGELFGGLDTGK